VTEREIVFERKRCILERKKKKKMRWVSAKWTNHENQVMIRASPYDFFIPVEIYELKSGWLLEFG
jgi:hypothetical protein